MNPYLIATQTIKDLLNINNLSDAIGEEDATPVLQPSSSRKLSHIDNSQTETINLLDLAMSGPTPTKASTVPLNNIVSPETLDTSASGAGAGCLQLFNNCTLVVPDPRSKMEDDKPNTVTHLKVWCPPPIDGDVSHSTNSSFCKMQKLIHYSWPKTENVNLMAVCRTRPLVAYVIDVNYKRGLKRDDQPSNQILRLLNYDSPEDRVIYTVSLPAPVADVAFPYLCMDRENENRIALVDKRGNINIIAYKYSGNDIDKSSIRKVLEILSDHNAGLSDYVRLTWCPFVPVEDEYDVDCGMRLALSTGTTVEIFAIDKLSTVNKVTRTEAEKISNSYHQLSNLHKQPLVSIHLSNDATVLATASMDNAIKFIDINEVNGENKILHNWVPKFQGSDKISSIYFLDDYNYLLENSEHHFWANIFIGTERGHISIWNMKTWLPVQKIYLECDGCDPESRFRYKMDVTANVIIAMREDRAFVLMIDANSENDDGDAYPLISKISRFQLYTSIVCFTVKKKSDKEIDLFWITEKSLERCTIAVDELIEKESPDWNVKANSNNKLDDILGLESSEKDNLLASTMLPNRFPPSAVAPSVALAQVFGTIPQNENSFDARPADNSSRRPSTPSSQEVANLLNTVRTASPLYSWSSNVNNDGNTVVEMVEETKPSYSLPTVQQLPDDVVTQDQLKNIEQALIRCVNMQKDQIRDDIAKAKAELSAELLKVKVEFSGDMLNTKLELREASQIKSDHFSKIVNNLVKKLMDQMNSTFSKGLEEFIGQVRRELNQVSDQVQKLKGSFKTQCDIQKQQQTDFEKKMTEFSKLLHDCSVQQKSILQQLQQQAVVNQSFAGAMSPAVRYQTPSSTPLPGSASNSVHYADEFVMSPNLSSIHEQLVKQQREEQRKATLKMQIMQKFNSKDNAVILDGLVQALNFNDPALVTKVCQMYINNPDELARIASKDQFVLISLLSQLANSDLSDEKWKVKFVTSIIMLLDTKSGVVLQNLSKFIKKLIAKLEALHNLDKSDDKVALTVLVLKNIAG